MVACMHECWALRGGALRDSEFKTGALRGGSTRDGTFRDGVLRGQGAQRTACSGMGCSGMRYSKDEVLRGNGLGTEQSMDAGAGLMMVQAMSPHCSCLLILKQHVGPHLDHS